MDFFEPGFLSLLILSFLSATILPLSSEGVLLLMLATGYNPFMCIVVASVGNILGGSTNYLLGRIGDPLWLSRFGVKEASILRFEVKIQRFGSWLALLSWLPFIGDPLVLALGFFRAPIIPVFVFMAVGKIARYMILSIPWLI